MNKTAIAFSTKDRVELTKRSVEPLLQEGLDVFLVDGSTTREGEEWLIKNEQSAYAVHANVRGGADAAIVYGLTLLLNHPNNYDFVGLCENDVLLSSDWFEPTMALFERGRADGLEVGAVSARCYEDRILIQRDGYAVCHNFGAGHVIFTREAARLVLDNFRTGWTTDNRLLFGQLSGLDLGRWWAFRDGEHHVTSDWHYDTTLAAHGFASLALTPSPCEMIGQVSPLAEQGLTIATKPVEVLRNDEAFDTFVRRTADIRAGAWLPGGSIRFQRTDAFTIFPHQFAQLGAQWTGDWRLKWSQGFGPFSWQAGEPSNELDADYNPTGALPTLMLPLLGGGELLVGGGMTGGRLQLGEQTLDIPSDGNGEVSRLAIQQPLEDRPLTVKALTPGITIYGLRTPFAQPWLPQVRFDHSSLPPV